LKELAIQHRPRTIIGSPVNHLWLERCESGTGTFSLTKRSCFLCGGSNDPRRSIDSGGCAA
jgi:hypothetical protein